MRRDGHGSPVSARAARVTPVTFRAMAAIVAAFGLAGVVGTGGCVRAPACDGIACVAACPRDAAVDASGRCACADGDVLVLGACVPPPIAASFCGPASRSSVLGGACAFRACEATEVLDAVTGACVPRGSLPHGGALACDPPAAPILEDGRMGCAPAAATCPRDAGYRDAADGGAGACIRLPTCPAGTLYEGPRGSGACRPVVTQSAHEGAHLPRVDVGAWTELAIGVDGGRGSAWLCQPLSQRPTLFGAGTTAAARDARGKPPRGAPVKNGGAANGASGVGTHGDAAGDADAPVAPIHGVPQPDATGAPEPIPVRISVAATFPDDDVSRLHVAVDARIGGASPHALDPAAAAVVTSAVTTLFELLRGMGGEASAAAVAVDVTCALARSR